MNKITGKITDIRSSDNVSLISIDVGGDIFSSLILEGAVSNYRPGDTVSLLFKETEVGIGKNLSGMISLRNRFPSSVASIQKGKILTRVNLNYKNHLIGSIISTSSAERLALKDGDQIEWLVKSNEITLMK